MLDDGSISIYLLLNGCPVNGSTLCDEQIIARHGLSSCSCNELLLAIAYRSLINENGRFNSARSILTQFMQCVYFILIRHSI